MRAITISSVKACQQCLASTSCSFIRSCGHPHSLSLPLSPASFLPSYPLDTKNFLLVPLSSEDLTEGTDVAIKECSIKNVALKSRMTNNILKSCLSLEMVFSI